METNGKRRIPEVPIIGQKSVNFDFGPALDSDLKSIMDDTQGQLWHPIAILQILRSLKAIRDVLEQSENLD